MGYLVQHASPTKHLHVYQKSFKDLRDVQQNQALLHWRDWFVTFAMHRVKETYYFLQDILADPFSYVC
jgi:hypothetical protein